MIEMYPPTPRAENLSDAAILDLISAGWRSVSNKYRTIARVPEGETGIEACKRSGQFNKCWTEEMAASHYMRCYAHKAGTWLELDDASFRRFKKLGGRAA